MKGWPKSDNSNQNCECTELWKFYSDKYGMCVTYVMSPPSCWDDLVMPRFDKFWVLWEEEKKNDISCNKVIHYIHE